MAVQLILKNSSVEDRRPTAAQLTTGELALNYNEEGAFLSCKDSAGNIQQVGGVKIAEAAPSAPVEQTLWFQPSTRELRVYNGSSWAVVSDILPDSIVNADINSAAAIAGTKISPDFGSQAVTTTGLISADGKVSFPLGTAALPSLYPGSDTNTGIYSPGANQVAISTNGTGRLFVDSSGDVGIGGTLPSSPNISLNANGLGEFGGGVKLTGGNRSTISNGITQRTFSGEGVLDFTVSDEVKMSLNLAGDAVRVSGTTTGTDSTGVALRPVIGGTHATHTSLIIRPSYGSTSNVTDLYAVAVRPRSKGSATITNNYGYHVGPDGGVGFATLGSATNIGYYSDVDQTTGNDYNFYAEGSAPSYFKGSTSIGGTSASPNISLNADGSATFAGDITCTNNSKGLILKSPDGTSFRLSVANDGTLSASAA